LTLDFFKNIKGQIVLFSIPQDAWQQLEHDVEQVEIMGSRYNAEQERQVGK